MLTPNQILNHSFATSRGSYKADEVDEFINEIVESYQQMFKENGEMLSKLEILAKRVEEYRHDEDNIKAALITAQKMSERIISEAREGAQKTIADAEQNAKTTLADAEKISNELLEKSASEANNLLTSTKASTDKTLAEAEATANEVIDASKLLADNVISQAKASSEEILSSVKIEIEAQQAILDELKIQSTNFKSELLEVYHANIESINEIPALIEEEYAVIKKKRQNSTEFKSSYANEEAFEEIEEAASAHLEEVEEPIQEVEADESTQIPSTDTLKEESFAENSVNIDEPIIESPTAIFDKVSDDDIAMSRSEPEDNIEAPVTHDHSIKFGEDYSIDDDNDYDDDDEDDDNQGFKGFFKRKK